jgi:hypothetical protein
MEAQPIVNRLQEEFRSEVAFEYLNAVDEGIGQAAFEQLGLRGHPAVVIFNASGQEIYRSFGLVEEAPIREVLDGL